MCVCAHIVSSKTQVKQVMFTLIETNVINTFRSLSDYTVSISQQTFHRSFPLTVHVYQQASSVGSSLFSLHLYTKNFACKRIKSKPSSVVVFPSCPTRICVGLIENLAQLKLSSFKHISNLTQKDWVCSHWHIK